MYKNIAIALLIGTTEGIKLTSFEKNVVESHYVNKGFSPPADGPGIAPVTFPVGKDTDTYDHSHSVTGSNSFDFEADTWASD